MDGKDPRSLTLDVSTWNWRIWFLLGWGVLILLGGTFTIYTWLVSIMSPSAVRIDLMIAILWGLSLIWLAVLLEDIALPLALIIAGVVWWIYTRFEVNVEAHVPIIIAGCCLVGGTSGGILGGVIRKINKSSQSLSLMWAVMGSFLGLFLGYGVILLFTWSLWG